MAALLLTIYVGAWLAANGERSAPAASPDEAALGAGASDASGEPVVTASSTSADVEPRGTALTVRQSLAVGNVPVSFKVPTGGWERFGDVSLNKSIVGPQGAEAIIFWSRFPHGDIAEPCGSLKELGVRPSAGDLAAAVARTPGTELVRGPSNVTVGGQVAKHVVLIVRENVGCKPGFFFTWKDVEAGALWTSTPVGSTIRVWIVDVGTLLVIEAETNNRADSDLEGEIMRIVQSIRFPSAP